VQLDVTSDEDVAAVVRLGPVDILVNNAGVAGYGNPVTMDFTAVREETEVNSRHATNGASIRARDGRTKTRRRGKHRDRFRQS
jgi:NAD(P)-dependent dehydrogenase (short-subunit alcohol dehydrogenase family)